MFRKLQLILMIFCLGIFVFPKQVFDIGSTKSSCCAKTSEIPSDCCKVNDTEKTKSCHQDSKKEKSCNDSCSSCKTCTTGFVFSVILNNHDNQINISFFEDKNQYSFDQESPFLRYFNIWQPPKLG